jgi:hypothetical protein
MHEPHFIQAATMHELHDALCDKVLYGHKDSYDAITNTDVVLEHVYGTAERMEFDHDIRRLWIPRSRWTTMVRQYLSGDLVNDWLELVERRGHGKNPDRMVYRTNTVQPRGVGKARVRNLGSCMLSLSLSVVPHPHVLLHSRASYMGYLSALDMAVAYHLTRHAAKRIGCAVDDFQFTWFIETVQYHRFRTIAYPLGDRREQRRFVAFARALEQDNQLAEYPGVQRAFREYKRWREMNETGILYSGMSPYRSYQRPRKRWCTERYGHDFARRFETPDNRAYPPLPSTPVVDLSLEKIGIPD